MPDSGYAGKNENDNLKAGDNQNESADLVALNLEPGVAEALYLELQTALKEAGRLGGANEFLALDAEPQVVSLKVWHVAAEALNAAFNNMPSCCTSRTNPCPGNARCRPNQPNT